ncbi:hypothetical protein FRB94_013328 [Tulasnella sp. JGI-2019a]|nr:hypothetical protein FRB94_013328 [Tulasnella sp. JGI-2019a]
MDTYKYKEHRQKQDKKDDEDEEEDDTEELSSHNVQIVIKQAGPVNISHHLYHLRRRSGSKGPLWDDWQVAPTQQSTSPVSLKLPRRRYAKPPRNP